VKRITFVVIAIVFLIFFSSSLFNYSGIFCYRLNNLQQAASFYYLALKINPNNLSALHNLAVIEKDKKNLLVAQLILEKLILKRPKWALAHKSLGVCLQLEGNIQGAEKEYLLALNLNPKLASAWNNLGVLYAHQADFVQARCCYLKALDLDPRNNITLSNYNKLNSKSRRM